MNPRRLLVTSATVVLLGGLLGSEAASAATTTEVIQGEVLRIVSIADWDAASTLIPGEPVQWSVDVSANAPEPAIVRLSMSAEGGAPLLVDIARCTVDWQPAGCAGETTSLKSAWAVPRTGEAELLLTFPTSDVAHLRLSVSLGVASTESTQLTVVAQAGQESIAAHPDGGLATTGSSAPATWLLVAAMLLIVLGSTVIGVVRRRDREEPT
ncbi:hypothetical protein GCM10010458_28290 [Microbacterium luteolum]|uniref:LPXTG cell wall anchor domain-containing protein n=1 Tax=Microbacterium luteolum TaxID=69367 RepID=A0ABY7XI39_MICLT|nr:hypothetical protein [Microbacterium luteolum]WDM41756.1 hypothetical protein KV395_00070 [Microbacterium luteolum]